MPLFATRGLRRDGVRVSRQPLVLDATDCDGWGGDSQKLATTNSEEESLTGRSSVAKLVRSVALFDCGSSTTDRLPDFGLDSLEIPKKPHLTHLLLPASKNLKRLPINPPLISATYAPLFFPGKIVRVRAFTYGSPPRLGYPHGIRRRLIVPPAHCIREILGKALHLNRLVTVGFKGRLNKIFGSNDVDCRSKAGQTAASG